MLPCEQSAAAGYSCKSTHQLPFGMKENVTVTGIVLNDLLYQLFLTLA